MTPTQPPQSDGRESEAALREALEPFAKAAEINRCGEWRDRQSIQQTDAAYRITFGDLRRAAALLSSLQRGEGGT